MNSKPLDWLRRGLKCLGVSITCLGASAAAWANPYQGAPPAPPSSRMAQVTKSYLNKNVVQLPIVLDERVRPLLQEVQLFVKEGPTGAWSLKERVPATQQHFTFRAPSDGEYGFAVVTVDKQGRSVPADVNAEPPALVVIIDTTSPAVQLQQVEANAQGQTVQCDVQDANLEAGKLKFYYQSGDRNWRMLEPLPGTSDKFCIPAQAVFTGMVRVQATDLAGNTTSREMNLSTAVAAAPAVEPKTQVVNAVAPPPGTPGVVMVDGGGEKVHLTPPPTGPKVPGSPSALEERGPMLPAPVPTRTADKSPTSPGVEVVAHKPAADTRVPQEINSGKPVSGVPSVRPNLDAGPKRESATPTRQLLNQTHVFLEYEIERTGASGVGKVEVWVTRDQGQSWQKAAEDTDLKSPAEFDLPGEGLYGVSLVVSNGRGFGGSAPQTGDRPEMWIEVDVTKPSAEIMSVRPSGQDDGALIITWQARDKNLGENPVDLFFALKREGPWLPIARGLKNDGIYRWVAPGDAGASAFLRLMVRDHAGNVTHCETLQPIALDDLSRPRGRVLRIGTQPQGPMGTLGLLPEPK